jgi:hypothetical protein
MRGTIFRSEPATRRLDRRGLPLLAFAVACGAVLLFNPPAALSGRPTAAQAGPAQDQPVPQISGQLGPCTADFVVLDPAQKPIYNANVSVIIRYGFMGKKDTSLEIGTGPEGKARVIGLPSVTRGNRPLSFTVRKGAQIRTVLFNPSVDCHATSTIVLERQPE